MYYSCVLLLSLFLQKRLSSIGGSLQLLCVYVCVHVCYVVLFKIEVSVNLPEMGKKICIWMEEYASIIELL